MIETAALVGAGISNIQSLIQAGRYQEAEIATDELRSVAEALPLDAASRADYDHAAGVVTYHLQKYDASIAALSRAVRIRSDLGDEVKLAETLRDLGASQRANGNLKEAERLYRQARAILERHFPEGDIRTADLLSNLSVLYVGQSRLAESEIACRRSLELRRRLLGPDDNMVGQCLSNLGHIVMSQGRLVEGERFCREGLEVREKALPPDHPDIAASLNNLAVALFELGDYTAAEEVQRRVLEIDVKVYGAATLEVATDFQNLAELRARQRRFTGAIVLQRQALAIRREKLPPDHPDLALTLGNLANTLDEIGELAEAAQLYAEAIAIEQAVADGSPSLGLATSVNNFGDMVRRQGDLARAQATFEQALAALPGTGRRSRLHTSILNNLADIEHRQGEHEAADHHFQAVVDIRRTTLPSDHPDLAHSLSRLADIRAFRGDLHAALRLSREAVESIGRRLASGSVEAPALAASEARMAREVLITHLGLLVSADAGGGANLDEFLGTIQMALATDTSVALSRMAERHALSVAGIGPEVARLRNLIREERAVEESIAEAASQAAADDGTALIDKLRNQLRSVREEREAIQRSLPAAIERLYGFERVALTDLRSVIGEDEAVLIAICSERFGVAALLGPTTASLARIELSRTKIAELISRVRASIDLSKGQRALPVFDLEAARALGSALIRPFSAGLAGVQHLLCVFDEPLASVPLAIYPDVLSGSEDAGFDPSNDHVGWFIDRMALTAVPSPSSLHAIRTRAGRSQAPFPFIGFGAPKVEGLVAGSLPRAQEQLEAMRAALGGEPSSVYVDKAASKKALLALDLKQARVIAFATHGFMADEAELAGGPNEPALLLSGPAPECFLAASEIAELEMDADWAVLSACNTAAATGVGSEGLSGIARAFFEAGTRTLLVSHWAVSELSTTLLLRTLFDSAETGPGIARAERLRRAMIHVRDRSLPVHAHPAFWGAFSIVGEGWRS